MRLVRALRTGTVTGVIVWKLAALALLPAAFCCQAVLAADGTLPCCSGKDHGDYCPLKQATPAGSHDTPRLQTCESFDDALLGLLGLTGFTPETADPQTGLDESGLAFLSTYSASSLDQGPLAPPPRA